MRKLTEKQSKVLAFIKAFKIANGYPPTIREIGSEFHITVKGAYDHVKAIEKKGYIERKSYPRGINIIDDKNKVEQLQEIIHKSRLCLPESFILELKELLV